MRGKGKGFREALHNRSSVVVVCAVVVCCGGVVVWYHGVVLRWWLCYCCDGGGVLLLLCYGLTFSSRPSACVSICTGEPAGGRTHTVTATSSASLVLVSTPR